VPDAMAETEDQLEQAAERVGWPCVVKPSDRGRSVGVTTNITNLEGLIDAFRLAREHSEAPVMVERHIPGDIYRILVVRGRVACVIRREAPHVFGDGTSTLRQLVEAQNNRIAAGNRPGSFVGEIPMDDDFHAELARQQTALDEVIAAGRKIMLRKVPLLSTGAMYSDVTQLAHPDIIAMAESMTEAFGFEICGIDYMSSDITASYSSKGAVLELNITPGLRVPLMAGLPAETIGRMILGDKPGRIPVHLVLCWNTDSDKARHKLPIQPFTGWVVGNRCGVGATPLVWGTPETEPTVYELTQQVLRNRRSERLIVLCDPEVVIREGLPVDRCESITACNFIPDMAWRRTFELHSNTYGEVEDIDAAFSQLRNQEGSP